MSAAERLLKLAQESIERERAAFKAEMDLERAKLAEQWREVDRLRKQLVPPTLEPKPVPVPAVVGESPPPPSVPQGLIDITDSYSAVVLAALIERSFKGN